VQKNLAFTHNNTTKLKRIDAKNCKRHKLIYILQQITCMHHFILESKRQTVSSQSVQLSNGPLVGHSLIHAAWPTKKDGRQTTTFSYRQTKKRNYTCVGMVIPGKLESRDLD